MKDGLYPFLSLLVPSKRVLITSSANTQVFEWYRKLGHVEAERQISASIEADGIPDLDRSVEKDTQCTTLILSKSRRAPLQHPFLRNNLPIPLTHTHMSEKISVPSLGGAHYFAVFLDSCFAMSSVYVIAQKI